LASRTGQLVGAGEGERSWTTSSESAGAEAEVAEAGAPVLVASLTPRYLLEREMTSRIFAVERLLDVGGGPGLQAAGGVLLLALGADER